MSIFSWWLRLMPARSAKKAVQEPRAQRVRVEIQAEQRRLNRLFKHVFAQYEERLRSLSERCVQLRDQALLGEAESISAVQSALETALRRLQAAERDTRSLLNEWHDWQQYPRVEHDRLRRLREEILRSELVLRDVRVPERSASANQVEVALPVLRNTHTADARSGHWDLDKEALLIETWHEILRPRVTNAVRYWEERAQEVLMHPEPATADASRVMRARRDAHALKRTLERRHGPRPIYA